LVKMLKFAFLGVYGYTLYHHDTAADKVKQLQVDDHFTVIPEEEKPTPYTDKVFKEAAIQWLIETNQVPFCCLFEIHP